jgi:hypothetical protein
MPIEASLLGLAPNGDGASEPYAYNDRHVGGGKAEFVDCGGKEVEGTKHDAASKCKCLNAGEC